MQSDLITPGATVIIGYRDQKLRISVRPVQVLKVDVAGFYAICGLRHSCRRFLYSGLLGVYPQSAPAPTPNGDTAAIVTRLGPSLVNLAYGAHLDATDSALLTDAIDDASPLPQY